jgi:3-methylcrotonyl-CoA carboxylase alpha subunit
MAAAAMVAHTLTTEKAAAAQPDAHGWNDPWAQRDGWKSHGPSVRAFAVNFQGAPHTVLLTTLHGAGEPTRELLVDGVAAPLRYASTPAGALDVSWGAQRAIVNLYIKGDIAHVFTAQGATQIVAIDALAHAGDTHGDVGRLTAPMPGKVVSFAVKAGDKVKKGQALAVMDAMKMEHTIAAPADGTVAELLFAPGDQVTDGAELLRMEVGG